MSGLQISGYHIVGPANVTANLLARVTQVHRELRQITLKCSHTSALPVNCALTARLIVGHKLVPVAGQLLAFGVDPATSTLSLHLSYVQLRGA